MKSSTLALAIACAKDLALASDNSCADSSCDADVTTLLQGGLRTHSLKLVQTHLNEVNTPAAIVPVYHLGTRGSNHCATESVSQAECVQAASSLRQPGTPEPALHPTWINSWAHVPKGCFARGTEEVPVGPHMHFNTHPSGGSHPTDSPVCTGANPAIIPAAETPPGTYIGCFVDDSSRDLQEGPMTWGYTSVTCNAACQEYSFFALQAHGWCVCGNAYGTEDQYDQVPNGVCGPFCDGDAHFCGSNWRNAVYSTGRVPVPEWEPEASSLCEEAMEGMGDFTLVRHAAPGNQWHGATDRLGGTAVYGDPAGGPHSEAEWSIAFNVEDVHTFLFATGDCEKWLLASKDAVIGEYYANMPRQIMESSTSEHPYMATWYNREAQVEDPWISLGEHFASIQDGSILYGENHFGHAHAELVLPVHEGANVFVELWSSPCEAAVQGANGWTLVRHAPPGDQWYRATDRLGGTAVYGDPAGGPHSETEWSITFNVDDVSTFLFATGDCENWLVASKDAVIGEYYGNEPRQIMRSSTSEVPYTARWHNRESEGHTDPWISLGDHVDSVFDSGVLYAGNHYPIHRSESPLSLHGGGNVFVKL